MSNSNQKRKFRVIHLFLIVLGAYIIVNGYHWWTFSKPFDKAAWIASANELETPTTRQRMVKYIQRRTLRTGMTKSEIIDSLGEPNSETYFGEYDLVYVLGPEQGWLSIDYEWLCIELDEQGLFVLSDIRTD